MSHISTGKVLITDLSSLAKVCQTLGLELRRDQKTYRTYAGRTSSCEHAIVHGTAKDAYQIGLLPARFDKKSQSVVACRPDEKKDGWMLGYDAWAGGKGMMDVVGKNCDVLMQSYGVAAARAKASQLGWGVQEVKQQDGSVRLVLTPAESQAQQQVANW